LLIKIKKIVFWKKKKIFTQGDINGKTLLANIVVRDGKSRGGGEAE